MSAGDENDFIVPPPGMVPTKTPPNPTQAESDPSGEVIEMPPGVVDSGTYRMPQPQVVSRPSLDDAPAFFPASTLGAPAPEPAPPASQHSAPPPIDDAISLAARAIDDKFNDEPNDAVDEETRFVAAPRATLAWQITLADGTQLSLHRTTLLGRGPAINAQWPDAAVLPVIDPLKSVSKTHAALQVTPDGDLVAHDLHSTNGVFLQYPEAAEIAVRPGEAVQVRPGSQLRLGQFVVAVDRI
ncbi:FHA domain-containing protein [Salinibacterium sp. M195]|uniref:FHA domain-containing protein n=1 Tax=Salinibacterium sp. M195 TaxID=2583374 RepID=UPI001C6333ED|nr:FHA domain-containing protein [Salinibacterium sp. M195]QYH35714.1 FHA domain-containing protein [Salinibacterium sp. M195]